MDDINDILRQRAADASRSEDQRCLTESWTNLSQIDQLVREAYGLLVRLNYPREGYSGLYPRWIVRNDTDVAAWLLLVPDDEGYFATRLYMTVYGELVWYDEETSGGRCSPRVVIGRYLVPYRQYIEDRVPNNPLARMSNTRQALRRVEYFLKRLGEIASGK